MEEETREKGENNVPVLKVNGISDIHYEKPDNFRVSIHSATYTKACGITKEIIRESKILDYAKDPQSEFGWGTDLRNREQVCNILFFTGEKGTGKTSTMLSFMEFLKDYHRISGKKGGMSGEFSLGVDQPYMFTGIEYIDASVLNDKEDILGNVLSKMLSKWNNEENRGKYQNSGIIRGVDYDYKKHQMYLRCEELFDRLKAAKSIEKVMENDSDMFIESMESLSFSWNLRNSFQRLVECYLDIMEYPDSGKEINKENHYLVISIDDIDMNVQFGFMLLEQIRKYLMVPNVLVLMSANYEQLEKICYNHYLKEFGELAKKEENVPYLRKISREYLEKMIPVHRQIELFSNRGWKFFSDKKLQIQYREDTEDHRELKEEGTLSEIASRWMYQYFGVGFALDKKCICHLAPDTVRETCNWVCQIKLLRKCFENSYCKDISGFDDNFHWFMTSEFPRLCRKYLDADNNRMIEMLDFLEPAEQIELIRKVLSEKLERVDEKSLLKLFADAKKGHKDVQDFVSLCLIYFNMTLQRLTVQMYWAAQSDPLTEMPLIKYYSIGGWGVFGAWEKDMLAPMAKWQTDESKRDQKLLGYCRIARCSFKADNGCLTLDVKGMFNAADKSSINNYIDKNKEQLINYQWLLLFYKLQEIDLKQAEWIRSNGKLELQQSRTGIFCLSGFALNSIDRIPLVKKFQDWLWMEFSAYIPFSEQEEENIRKKVFINLNSGLLLPLQDVDFIVYLGSELQKRLGGKGHYTRLESMKPQIGRYFEVIDMCLQEYNSDYYTRFHECELVNKILTQDKSFMTLLGKAIEAQTEPEDIPWADEEWSGEEANG